MKVWNTNQSAYLTSLMHVVASDVPCFPCAF
ncbi:hypothetical protein NC652_001739 [Populus alba x Populus x berolinensis]|uniref:Uncharacterized protein n=1 Tax=Populus alba x Populus x berolinensis TaxID=444605 RepID=A0AAD6RN79_9ROSI|nr:hypothetical protein NC651_001697 [Populus alba x Populus x berolinensis]KAJ6963205.1 hypothetical protein NC652_001739 [Populus alba x Populus x berolinensis]KAJ7011455.1 hypothetical protein NC653_001784 [Populus alba x Populus x berolinensis]